MGMDNRAVLLLDKLVMAGHSMGGATALKVGNTDERVKCTLLNDPWLVPLDEDIKDGSLSKFK
jgi:pimeloyl-ACP methyl ester carboxylesterase